MTKQGRAELPRARSIKHNLSETCVRLQDEDASPPCPWAVPAAGEHPEQEGRDTGTKRESRVAEEGKSTAGAQPGARVEPGDRGSLGTGESGLLC